MFRRDQDGWTAAGTAARLLEDRGLQLGDGVFETFRIVNGSIRHSRLHHRRLDAACAALQLAPPDWDDIERAVARLAAGPDAAIGKVQVTRGAGGRGLAPVTAPQEALYLQFSPFPDVPQALRLSTATIRRSATSLSARFKTLSYVDNLAARREAASRGADMALLLTESGLVSGGDSANLFWRTGGEVQTPSLACGIRNGVMRQQVLSWLDGQALPAVEVAAGPGALEKADLVWVTNTVIGVVPVSEIDGRALPVADSLYERMRAAAL
ncbi:aminotransferase class IV [Hyphobacterium indicum]|uniref:aminotransferase class IV n=1 Tax=Hyphobacterium indicum TaxID=2162714 RepID=UPI000D64FC40|nr:aminotransferase class IV [Hyphobacterium indicum]